MKKMIDQSISDILKKRISRNKERIVALSAELERDEMALAIYEPVPVVKEIKKESKRKKVAILATAKNKQFKKNLRGSIRKGPTVANKADAVFEKFDIPLTRTELLNAINELFPGKKISANSWSPQLSVVHKNPKNGMQKFEFEQNPSETRFFYGKKHMADGNRLRPEYLEKLAKKHKWSLNGSLFHAIQ